MTLPQNYRHNYIPTKYFLSSYRALSDGRSGIRNLNDRLKSVDTLLFEWKVGWIGACTILRTSIDLFKIDAKSCLPSCLTNAIKDEWKFINSEKDKNEIFWHFLKKERDSIIHQYEWRAYEAWIKQDGTFSARRLSLISMYNDDGARPVIRMNGGKFSGRDSLELLTESSNWIEERIFSAVRRAGFNPDEERNMSSFQTRAEAGQTLAQHLKSS
ncbi:hypothetical protein [Ancylobacter rudongensis]|uniref:hypothetical protein n=1 Tax=Ancylobacter rudongensis TaxID=177413 RepID=UPI00115FB942|nr:hypothetical protein [Ancylobacter rudongensis]